MAELRTTADVIDALGGNIPVAALLTTPEEPVTNKAVSNWRRFETFPANTYVALTAALRAIGQSAPDSLWGMKGVSVSEKETAA